MPVPQPSLASVSRLPIKDRVTTKDWLLEDILSKSPNFHPIPRVSALECDLTARIADYDSGAKPLIIENWHLHPAWAHDHLSLASFVAASPKDLDVRNVHNWSDSKMELAEFLSRSRALPPVAPPDESERFYGKDAACPESWTHWLHNSGVLPPVLLSESPTNLLLSLPPTERVETLMCYLGIGDTFTPCHKDLCGSSGQNLMCYTENGGSSFWFMTDGKDIGLVTKYFHKLKQELDHETHIVTIEELARAPFPVYIGEQKLGDLVLVPPRSAHQVVNQGGITLKTSWSRMTLKGLQTALYHELPLYQRVCRTEIYQVKSTIYHAMRNIVDQLGSCTLSESSRSFLQQELYLAFDLFGSILIEEFAPNHPEMPLKANSPELTHISCDFCGADIFQSFFECQTCVPAEVRGEGYIICPSCYVEGRSCRCVVMDPVQCRPFSELLGQRTRAIRAFSENQQRTILPAKELLTRNTGSFAAACYLDMTRRAISLNKERICSPKVAQEVSHPVEGYSALSCKKCHASKCFSHHLSVFRMHATDALNLFYQDPLHKVYHIGHQRSARRDALVAESQLREAEAEGVKPDLAVQRAWLAANFRSCKPINYLKAGWYDDYMQIVTIPDAMVVD